MFLKMRGIGSWVIVPDIGYVEYGSAKSKRMGFYEIEAPGYIQFNVEVLGRKTLVPVIKLDLSDDNLYYPNDDIVIIRSSNNNLGAEKVRVIGRSKHEVTRLNDNEEDIHVELVTFMSWLRDKLGMIYLFDEAYLLNNSGDTIEHIF